MKNEVQSDEYFAKVPITFEAEYGDVHVAFSESMETENVNRVYEFLLGGYGNSVFEIRRKDYLLEKRNFNGNRFADNRVSPYRQFNAELSISKSKLLISLIEYLWLCLGGVVQIVDLDSQFKFNLTDRLPVIPVKYISFAGFMGSRTKVIFDCVNISNGTDVPTAVSETTTGSASAMESLEALHDGLLGKTVDDEINKIVPRENGKEEPTELATVT
ncbi:hypothetical protein HA402_004143 [Bradysia odoriphaga]|nr:hypothetical protein HA402_004143 [Bradysia odoriphaga]